MSVDIPAATGAGLAEPALADPLPDLDVVLGVDDPALAEPLGTGELAQPTEEAA